MDTRHFSLSSSQFLPCLAHSQCHSNTWLIVNSQSPCQEKSGVEGIAGVYEEPSFRSLWSSAFFSIIDMKMLDIYNNALAWRTKQGRILTKYLVLMPPLRRPKSLTSAQLEISLQDSPMNWILCWTLRCLHVGEADWTDNSGKGIFYEQTRWALEGERESHVEG